MIQEIIAEMLARIRRWNIYKAHHCHGDRRHGAGKTTTIGKLCHQLKARAKRCWSCGRYVPCGCIDQLEVWTQRAGVDIVKHAKALTASVVYDAIDAAKARGCDVLICDTAGRLHNKKNLMQELAKINRIIETRAEGCHRKFCWCWTQPPDRTP